MDGGKYDTAQYAGANGKLAVRLGIAGRYSPAVTPTITYTRLPPGKYVLVASLANNDLSDTGVHARVVSRYADCRAPRKVGKLIGHLQSVAMKLQASRPGLCGLK